MDIWCLSHGDMIHNVPMDPEEAVVQQLAEKFPTVIYFQAELV